MSRRLTKDEWAAARAMWESSADATDAALGQLFGITRQAVTQKREREGWQKTDALRSITQRAQLLADQNCNGIAVGKIKAASVDAAVEVRTRLIEKHRDDWVEHRKYFSIKGIAAEFELGKSAKISAEMIKIRQDGERKAYGMDEPTEAQGNSVADALASLADKLPG